MTYVGRRARVFLEEKDIKPERRRSEGRLKSYPSSEDIRAWCDTIEDRRQHILDLVTKGYEKCRGTLVPIEALMNLAGDGGSSATKDVGCECQLLVHVCPEGQKGVTGQHTIHARAKVPGKIVTKVRGLQPGFHVETVSKDPHKIVTKVQDEKPEEDQTAKIKKESEPEPEPKPEPEANQDEFKHQSTEVDQLGNENTNLQNRLEQCLDQLKDVKSAGAGSPVTSSCCDNEMEALEKEIKIMRKGNVSPEEEADMIKREVDILRKYCLKLKAVEDENERLRAECKLSQGVKQEGGQDEIQNKKNEDDVEKINSLTKERDDLANKVKKLETELLKYKDLPDDIEIYMNRSKMLDNTLAERDCLQKKLENCKHLEEQVAKLQQKASRVDELERALKNAKGDVSSSLEMKKTQSKCICLERELANSKRETEALNRRLTCMKTESDNNREKAKDAEMLKLERDKLQIKVNELSHVQVHNENLALKCKCLENAAQERDFYKSKYEEILGMECQCDLIRQREEDCRCLARENEMLKSQVTDLESCIHEQEEEIKRLMCHLECLSKNKDDIQARMKDALANMRKEVEKKDHLIASSEEKLTMLQGQLKSSIQGVSCETLCYKTRIEELERELVQARGTIKKLQENGRFGKSVATIKKELALANEENRKLQEIAKKMEKLTGDEHVRKMLRQSECAVRKVVEELTRQYKEWDQMKTRNTSPKGRYCCNCKNEGDGENIKKLKEELERVKKENQELKTESGHKSGDGVCRCGED